MASFNIQGYNKAFITLSVVLLLSSSLVVGIDRAALRPLIVPGGSPSMCPSDEARQAGLQSIKNDVKMLLNNSLQGPTINDYCGPGQWHRVAYIDMTDPQQNCPVEWREYEAGTIRACGRVATCSRKTFSTNRQYSKVCGRIIGYQLSSTDAFQSGHGSIDGAYVDGVSVTYGNPRNHVWTFAGGWSEIIHPNSNIYNCPCSDSPSTTPPPSFVGERYFCESANKDENYRDNHLYTSDKLWDGEQCDNEGTCCTDKSPPWFSIEIPTPTVDAIEVHICGNEGLNNENTPIELLEIYIQ
jgi:hypothetical protein